MRARFDKPGLHVMTSSQGLLDQHKRAGSGTEGAAAKKPPTRLYLSPPHLGGDEVARVTAAIASGWIAPLGPEVDRFEAEFAQRVGSSHAVALSSGTAALHLALVAAGVQSGDEVAVSSFTFAASVYPIIYLGAQPVFIDSERESWNMDPALLAEAMEERARSGKQFKAIVLVHLYGNSADIDAIKTLAELYDVPLIEDAAEVLGATYKGASPGCFGKIGIFSFNGNKIITTSGGGMLVTEDATIAARTRKLATQAREPAPHYEHHEIGYNYRLSNLLAALGSAQLATLDQRIATRREHLEAYASSFRDVAGIEAMPVASWGTSNYWLSCITIDPTVAGVTREDVRIALEDIGIESRPLWKPMHLQPVFAGMQAYDSGVSTELFERGLCLPSGSQMTADQRDEVISAVRSVAKHA